MGKRFEIYGYLVTTDFVEHPRGFSGYVAIAAPSGLITKHNCLQLRMTVDEAKADAVNDAFALAAAILNPGQAFQPFDLSPAALLDCGLISMDELPQLPAPSGSEESSDAPACVLKGRAAI